jgi:hypothetical protein
MPFQHPVLFWWQRIDMLRIISGATHLLFRAQRIVVGRIILGATH